MTKVTSYLQLAAVILNDAARQGQSQSGTVTLRGKERTEDMGEVFRGDSQSGIVDGDRNRVLVRLGEHDRYPARPIERLDGIEKQVQKHLMELTRVVLDQSQFRSLPKFDLDGLG